MRLEVELNVVSREHRKGVTKDGRNYEFVRFGCYGSGGVVEVSMDFGKAPGSEAIGKCYLFGVNFLDGSSARAETAVLQMKGKGV